jgi:hypothetical protein
MLINKNSVVSFFPSIISVFEFCCKMFIKLVAVLRALYASEINISDVSSFCTHW